MKYNVGTKSKRKTEKNIKNREKNVEPADFNKNTKHDENR